MNETRKLKVASGKWQGARENNPCPLFVATCSFFLTSCFLLLVTSPANTQEEPTTIESEIGLDQIVVTRAKKDDVRAEKDAVVTKVEKSSPEEKLSGEPTLEPAPSAAKSSSKVSPSVLGDIDGKRLLQINRSLKQSIEANQDLEGKTLSLDQQLKNVRGQRIIENNRMETLSRERDALKDSLKRTVEERASQIEKQATTIEEYKNQIAQIQKELADKERDLRTINNIIEPGSETAKTDVVDNGEKVELSARELRDMQMTILSLQKQIATREVEIEQLTKEEQAAAQAELQKMKDDVRGKESTLAEKEKELEVLKTDYATQLAAREQEAADARQKAEAAQTEVANLQTQMAALQEKMKTQEAQMTAGSSSEATALEEKLKSPESDMTAAQVPAVAEAGSADLASAVDIPLALQSAKGAKNLSSSRKSQNVLRQLDALTKENAVLKEDEAQVHYNMGNIFYAQGQYRRAFSEYQQAVKMLPSDANAHFNLAFVAGEYLHDFKTAFEHYQLYLWLNPEAPDQNMVKEKMMTAQLELRSQIDSKLEDEVAAERTRVWK